MLVLKASYGDLNEPLLFQSITERTKPCGAYGDTTGASPGDGGEVGGIGNVRYLCDGSGWV